MGYKRPGFEITKDLLKSYISNLEGEELPVPMEVFSNGKIIGWGKKSREWVGLNEAICAFRSEVAGFTFLHSPAEGTLVIVVEKGDVIAGTTIAVVLPKSHVIKSTPPEGETR